MTINRTAVLVFMHCIGWLVFMCLPLPFLAGRGEVQSVWRIISSSSYWIFLLFFGLLFYTHTYLAFPRAYLQKKYMLYLAYLLLFFWLVNLLQPFDQLVRLAGGRMAIPRPDDFPGGMPGRPQPGFPPRQTPGFPAKEFDIVSIAFYLLTLAFSVAAILSEQLRTAKNQALEFQAKKIEAELSFLKAQINPHFLFNTLNNIYALVESKSEHAASAVLRLSGILRYVTEDATQTVVPIDRELDCIKDYLVLQELRLGKKTTIDFVVEGETMGLWIAPMVYMTFIENAFKYGVSTRHVSIIRIHIRAAGETLYFVCENTAFPRSPSAGGGIGLGNVRQRLEYLYKDDFSLDIDEKDELFSVKLVIRNSKNNRYAAT